MTPTAAITFLQECASYFERRSTNGEDAAFWANVQNAQNCRDIADLLHQALASLTEGGENAPGHTDLMVTPESIDAFMEANPLPPEDAGTGEPPICERDDCWHAGTCQGHCRFIHRTKGVADALNLPPPASMGEGEPEMAQIEEAFDDAAKARDEAGFLGTVADCIRYLDAEVTALRSQLEGRPPLLPDREGVARIMQKHFYTSHANGSDGALEAADELLTLLGGVHAE